MAPAFHSIGHSSRGFADFVALLEDAGVQRVLDVRKMPHSRANPQYGIERLSGALAARGIDYAHIAALGGLRGRSERVPPEVNAFWRNASFHRYADYALSAGFRAGLAQLLLAGRERASAMMCAEAVWWRCHRRIVADYLLARGERVLHIMGAGRVDPAQMTPGAVPRADGSIVYPAPPSP